MRELRRHIDTPLETRRHWPLPLQRLRALLQDERSESSPHQAETTPGKYLSCVSFLPKYEQSYGYFCLCLTTKNQSDDIEIKISRSNFIFYIRQLLLINKQNTFMLIYIRFIMTRKLCKMLKNGVEIHI